MRNLLAVLLLLAAPGSRAVTYQNSAELPPKIPREFRGVWIASVGNIDWPSKPGLTTAQQKAELTALLDRAAKLRLNAVIFQVRPACDSLYASRIEPWSEYLTGAMGKAPDPYYDPLEFAIAEAHRRGLELHAWFNPYRALHKSHQGKVAPTHISRTRPDLVRSFGEYLWLDPGERDVQEYSLKVVMDVVKRYDIDGVQFDDYFYPDPVGVGQEFSDDASWRKFGAGRGLKRDDWRRENVNGFIERVYRSIKAAKPWVKFGVSPFGIWRPGNPPQIRGSDPYVKLYADSRKWLVNGWVDYFSPQLYWPIEPRELSFPVLLNWWAGQNSRGRHLWPGIAAYRAGQWEAGELDNQIRLTRSQPGVSGGIFFSMKNLAPDQGVFHTLEQANTFGALVPASPWLGGATPAKPNASLVDAGGSLRLTWSRGDTNAVRWWVVQAKMFGDWKMEVLPGDAISKVFTSPPDFVAVTAIDRTGIAGSPRVLAPVPVSTPAPPSTLAPPPAKRPPPRALRSPKQY